MNISLSEAYSTIFKLINALHIFMLAKKNKELNGSRKKQD